MRWHYFQLLTTGAVRELHQAIKQALAEDDRLPEGKKVYGVREFPDFRQEADELETELDRRKEKFTRIVW